MKPKNRLVWDKTGGRCYYCGKTLHVPSMDSESKEKIKDWFVPDHMLPRSRGGKNNVDNLLPSCWTCNSKKGSKTLEEYRQYLVLDSIGVDAFTQNQVDFLREHGIEIPMPKPMAFWAERKTR